MIHLCQNCKKLLRDGERVHVEVEATYRVLKSTIAYALDKSDLVADSATLRHAEDCENVD